MSANARTNVLADLALSDSGFVFDPYSGGTFTANKTALRILTALREDLPRAAILDRLRSEFHVNGADLDADLGEFLRLLVQQGILPPDYALEAVHSAKVEVAS